MDCLECGYKCKSCETSNDNCLSCSDVNRDSGNNCLCKPGYL